MQQNHTLWLESECAQKDTPELKLFRHLIVDSLKICLNNLRGKRVDDEDVVLSKEFLRSISPAFVYSIGFKKPKAVIKLMRKVLEEDVA